MDQYNRCLLQVPVFQALTEDRLIAISDLIEPRHYHADETIYDEADVIETLGVIHRGSIKLRKINEDGKERILSILYPGDYFGEASLLISKESQYDIVALEESAICTIELDAFRAIMKRDETMMLSMMDSLIQRIASRDDLVIAESLVPAKERVLKALAHYATPEGFVQLPLSKKDLASSLGITPETMSRAINTLVREGILEKKENELYFKKNTGAQ